MHDHKSEIWDQLYTFAKECYERDLDFKTIHEMLLKRNDDEAMVFAVLKKVKSEHYAKSSQEGRRFLLIGLALMLAGFLITCINFHSNQSFAFAMYGLTSIGLIVLFYGVYKIIG